MPQLDGDLTVDEGFRLVEAGDATARSDRPSRSFDPADHRDESLGVDVYGAEDWMAPGMGDPHPDCGTHRVEGVCDSCGEIHTAPHKCGRRECPDCWGIWGKQTAMKRTVRLQEYRYTSDFKQAAHAVVAFEEPANSVWSYLDDRSRAADVAREKGFVAFDVIAHPTRITDEGKELIDRFQPDEDPRGDHVFLREEYTERYHFGLPNSLLEWAPHYHIIGVTSPDMDPAEESDPYVYKFIRSLDRFDLHDEESYEDVYGLYRYLLSHTGIHQQRQFQAVVGYAGLSNSTFQDHEPTAGIVRKIEEMTERVAESRIEDDEDDGDLRADDEEMELGECPDCDTGIVINVFRAGEYANQNKDSLDPDIRIRLRRAEEWRAGPLVAPAGLRRPSSQEEARQAFEEIVASHK